MAGLSLSQARTATSQLLDDPSERRWSTANGDRGLEAALSRCLVQYQKAGGERFDTEVTGTSSATTGVLDVFAGIPVLVVRDVVVINGNNSYRVPAKQPNRRGYIDLVARSLRVTYVREYALPSNAAWPLVGVDAVPANTWFDFDNWVCTEAALQLAPKDMEEKRLRWLTERAQAARRSVMERTDTPGGYPMPRRDERYYADPLVYAWVPASQQIHFFRVQP